ncbi:DsbA family protein [Arthrobacter sp. zg-Y20]|uniref:DsbA family protein n=1 Tax=unclassified Arthrobacter TaxID=235627 RepID=UPI001D13390F|nr:MULTISPECIES: thioredoxin domain-containing protein [unclassified Arthrobacter]MCC3276189.1 DsbA family protein [Arthrobacter sp. zg-Y20]MDK1316349.1 thioredoxin domain-containing protein [Arthrobacter sp. zg.Y20]WIB06398.1 thioredoxin domain-containing protein [Arthrobacter sp. zg-Y20]
MRRVVPSLIIAGMLVGGGVVSCGTPAESPAPEASASVSASPSTSASAEVTVPADQMDKLVPSDARTITDPADPQATLVLFTDYQCPYCAMMDPLIQQAKADYGDQVRIVIRNYPLPKHQNAEPSARAVEAAAEQGKLEEMAAKVFEHQEDWKTESDVDGIFASYAEELGLNMDQFNADYSSDAIKDRVARDLQDAQDLQVKGTPTLYLDGQAVQLESGAYSEISEPLDNALAK